MALPISNIPILEYLKGGVDELNSGKVVVKTMEELEAMENG